MTELDRYVEQGMNPPESWRGCSVTIGNFDGVHLGHRELMASLDEMGRRLETRKVAMTFHPHPAELVGGKSPQRLLPVEDRIRMLLACGADGVWVVPFTHEFASLSPQQFIRLILLDKLGVTGVVVGPDFRFGAERAGDSDLLSAHGKSEGFEVVVVPPLEVDGLRISSSLIRSLLLEGRVQAVAGMLGRPYRIKGEVVRGLQLGSKIGFPTANIDLYEDVLTPGDGVYIIRLRLGPDAAGARPLEGVASIGTRPTFDGATRAVEAHLFDVNRTLYGEITTMEFLRRIRSQEKFDSVDKLKARIAADVACARRFFKGQESIPR